MELKEGTFYVSEQHGSKPNDKILITKRNVFITVLVIAVLIVAVIVLATVLGIRGLHSSASDTSEVSAELETINCNVAIVGGGIAGLYTAESLLRMKKETSVCVFERENRLGGRFYDIRFNKAPNVSVAMGAWRVRSTNTILRGLMKRLNLTTEEFESPEVILEARGVISNIKTEFLRHQQIKQEAFPRLSDTKFANMSAAQMLSYLFETSRVETADQFATFYSYMSHYLTGEGAQLIADVYSFTGHGVSTKSAIEGLMYDSLSSSSRYERPLGGMSAIINALANSTRTLGGKIFISDQIHSINEFEKGFILNSRKRKIKAQKLVFATFPVALRKMSGSVARKIQSHRIFQSMNPQLAFKAAAVYNTTWWENTRNYSLQPMERYFSRSDCLQYTMPYRGKGPQGEAVLQMAYNSAACSRKWGDLHRQLSKPSMDKEMHRVLEQLFRRKIPPPLETAYKYWEDGILYLQKPGSNVTLKEVENWAKRPLNGEDIFIVGTDYSLLRGWGEGALRSVQNVLEEGWK